VNAEVKVTQPSLVLLCRKVSTMLLSQDGAAVGDTENRPDRQCTLWIPLLDGSLSCGEFQPLSSRLFVHLHGYTQLAASC
jgi:hypothetical protein